MKYYLGGVSLLALFACAEVHPAQAQQSTVVPTCGAQSIPAGQGTSGTYIDNTGNLCTNASGGGGGGNVNLTGINGVTPLVGAGATGTGSPRTTQGQDTTTVAGAAPLTTGIYVTGPSAAALATSANQSSVIGTKAAGTAATNSQLVGGVYNSSDPTLTNGQQASAQMTTKGELRNHDTDLLAAAQAGTGATGSAVPASAVLMGGRTATTHPTATTDGQLVAPMMSTEGKMVTDPFAPSSFRVSGTTTSTNTAAHTIIAAGAGSLKNYITDVQCGRTDAGTSPIVVTFSDAQSSIMIIPDGGNGGANNFHLASPLATAAATAFTMTSGSGVTTLYCNAQGYQAP